MAGLGGMYRTIGWCAVCLCALSSLAFGASASSSPYDLILSGGLVVDGSGAGAFEADVGVRGDTIVRVGDLSKARALERIDVSGKWVVPGFIDLHSHSDGADINTGLRSYNPTRRAALNLVTQGITTAVVNQDGRSPLDIARQKAHLTKDGMGLNAVLMVGHNTIRHTAMQGHNEERPVTPEELKRMRALLLRGMNAGAYGLSAGLEYEPGIWSTPEELTALVREIVPYGGVYIAHERSSGLDPMWVVPSQDSTEQPTMLDSIAEVIRIGEDTGATVVATHIKARGMDYWGKSAPMVEAINAARKRGVHIYADQYPYTSSGSDGSIVLLPYWILEGHEGSGTDYAEALRAVLRDPERARVLNRDIEHEMRRRGGAERILVMRHPEANFVGKSLAQLAEARGVSVVEMVYLLQLEGDGNRFGGAVLRGFSMHMEDIELFARQPWVATASDAGIALHEDGLVHARYYGTFPRKIRHFAINNAFMTKEEVIRSMTGLPAEILGFRDRGLVRPGFKADIVIVDPENIRDRATYLQPHQYASGVDFVWINGKKVVGFNQPTKALAGVVISPAPRQKRKQPPRQTDD